MNDPHARFQAFLADGGDGEPPRDVALHASACAECLRLAAAFDGLLAVNPGAAEPPPARPLPVHATRRPLLPPMRAAVGTAAAGMLVVAALIGAGALLERRTPPAALGTASPIAEAVLGGQGGAAQPVETATAEATPRGSLAAPSSASASAPAPSASDAGDDEDPSPIASRTDGPAAVADPTFVLATPAPTPAFQPPLGTPRPSASTLLPTARPSAAPTVVPTTAPTLEPTDPATQSPTPVPTLQPTPEPTPEPTPQPTPTPLVPSLPALP